MTEPQQIFGFPARLSIPKGRYGGLPLQLLVVISSPESTNIPYGPVIPAEYQTYQKPHFQVVSGEHYKQIVQGQAPIGHQTYVEVLPYEYAHGVYGQDGNFFFQINYKLFALFHLLLIYPIFIFNFNLQLKRQFITTDITSIRNTHLNIQFTTIFMSTESLALQSTDNLVTDTSLHIINNSIMAHTIINQVTFTMDQLVQSLVDLPVVLDQFHMAFTTVESIKVKVYNMVSTKVKVHNMAFTKVKVFFMALSMDKVTFIHTVAHQLRVVIMVVIMRVWDRRDTMCTNTMLNT